MTQHAFRLAAAVLAVFLISQCLVACDEILMHRHLSNPLSPRTDLRRATRL